MLFLNKIVKTRLVYDEMLKRVPRQLVTKDNFNFQESDNSQNLKTNL